MVAFGAIEGPVGALRQPSTNPYREGGRSSVAGCFTAPYQGLSPVRGNLHAGFLGEGWAARPAPYPPGVGDPDYMQLDAWITQVARMGGFLELLHLDYLD